MKARKIRKDKKALFPACCYLFLSLLLLSLCVSCMPSGSASTRPDSKQTESGGSIESAKTPESITTENTTTPETSTTEAKATETKTTATTTTEKTSSLSSGQEAASSALQGRIEELIAAYGFDPGEVALLLYYGNPNDEDPYDDSSMKCLASLNPDESYLAGSSVKIFAAICYMEAFRNDFISPEKGIPYLEEEDYEGGSGILQDCAADGEVFSAQYLLDLMVIYSDNIAFHMLDRYYGEKTGLGAIFTMARKFDLSVSPGKNILTARELLLAHQYIYANRANHYYAALIDQLYLAGEPSLFPAGQAAHKPGLYGASSIDAGVSILNDQPLFFALISTGTEDYVYFFADLANIIEDYIGQL